MSDKKRKGTRRSPVSPPNGLKEMVEFMTWLVSKEKPENICQFLIDCNRELLQFKNDNPSLNEREAIVAFQKLKEQNIRRLSEQWESSKNDEARSTSPAQPLLSSPSQPKRSLPTASKRRGTMDKCSKSDSEISDQKKQSVALVKSSSLQDCALMFCMMTDQTLEEDSLDKDAPVSDESASDDENKTDFSLTPPELAQLILEASLRKEDDLVSEEDSSESVDSSHFTELSQKPPELVELVHEAPLDEEDALLSDKESTDSGDSTHTSEVSLSSPELVPDVEVLQEASLEEAEHLYRPPSQPKSSSPTALKRRARKAKVSKSDGEICEQKKESVSLVKSSSLQDCVLMSCEVTELTLQEASLDQEDVPVSSKESSESVDRSHFTELSQTPPDHVELLHEAPLDKEDDQVSDETSSDSGDHTDFSDVSVTPPEQADELLQETQVDKEDDLLSDKDSTDSGDSTHTSEVSLSSPELVPDVEVLQEASVEEAEHLYRPPSQPKSSSPTALKRRARKAKVSKSDGEICDQKKESVSLVKSSSLQDCVHMSCEVTELTLQEAPLDQEDVPVSSKESSESVDRSHFTELSQTPPDHVELLHEAPLDKEDDQVSDETSSDSGDHTDFSDVSVTPPEQADELLQETQVDKEDDLLSDKESTDSGDSTHTSEVSLSSPELVPDVEVLQEASVEEAEHLYRPPSQPKSSSPTALKRSARKAKVSKSDGEICEQKKESVSLVKSSSLQDCVLMSCEVTELTLQEAPLDQEDVPVSSKESSESVDRSHFTELSQTPPDHVELLHEAPLDKEDDQVSDETSSDSGDHTDFSDVSVTPPEQADELLQETQVDKEDALLSDKDSTDSGDSTHTSEVSLSSPELVPDVEVLQEASVEEAEHLYRPPSQPKSSSPTALKRRARKAKVSKSDGEICEQKKESVSLVKSSSLQDCVLMSCEVTELTLQEAPLDQEDVPVSSKESSESVDRSHFTELSQTPPDHVELLHEAPLDKEDDQVSDETSSDSGDHTDFSDVSVTPPEQADELLQETQVDKEDDLLSDKESTDSGDSTHTSEVSLSSPELVPDVEVLQEASVEEAEHLYRPPSQPKSSSPTALKRSARKAKVSKSDGEICEQKKESVSLVKSSSLQDCVLMSCEVTELTLQEAPLDQEDVPVSSKESSESVDRSHFTELSQTPPDHVELLHEAPLDKEDDQVSDETSSDSGDHTDFSDVSVTPPEQADELLQETQVDKEDDLLSDKESTDSGDSTHTSEVSLSSPELVPDVEVLQEASVEEAEHLYRPPSQPKSSSPTALKRRARKAKVSKSDGEICDRKKESVSLVKSSSLQDCVLMSCEVTELTLQEASLDKEDDLLSDKDSTDSGDSTHTSEVSLSSPELVPDVEVLQEASVEEAEHLPRPPSQPKSSSPTALKRRARKAKVSKSDGEICEQKKESASLVKSSSLQDCVLMSCEVTELTLQEAPLDQEDVPVSSKESSESVDRSHFTELSQTPPDHVELLHEAPLDKEDDQVSDETSSDSGDHTDFSDVSVTPPEQADELLQETQVDKEDALLSDKDSTDSGDSTHTSEVSLSSPELVPDVEVLQEASVEEAEHLYRPPSQPKSSSPTALKRRARKAKVSKSDGEICDQKKESVSLVKSSSLQDCVLMSCEVTELTLQEASLDQEDVPVSSKESSESVDRSHFTELSQTPPDHVELLHEAPLDKEDDQVSDETSSDSGDHTDFSDVSVTPPEQADELLQETQVDKEDALLSDKDSTDSGDSTHTSEVSLSSPELVPDVEVLQEASVEEAEHLYRPPSQPKSSSPTALKRRARKAKVSKSDGEICDQKKESVSLVKSSSLQDCVLMSCEVTELTLQEAPLDQEDVPVSSKESSESVDRSHFTELSQTPPDHVELLHEAPLDKEVAPVSDEILSEGGDSTDSPTSSEPAELLLETPLDEEHALLSEGDSSESVDSSHFTELSQTPPECAEFLHEDSLDKEDLVSNEKSPDAGDRTDFSDVSLTPPEFAELFRDTPLDEEDALVSIEKSPDGRDSTHFSDVSLTPPEFAELFQDAPLDEEDALVSTEKSPDVRDSTHFSDVSLTPPEFAELFQDAPLDEEDSLLSDEKSDGGDSTHFSEISLTPPELADPIQEAPLDEEYAILSEGESSHSVKSSHFTELSQTPPELAEIPQEAPLDEEDAPVSDESSSDDEDKIDFSGVSLTPPELAQLILEASLRKVSEEDSSESVDSSHFTELSQTPPELVELVHEAPLDEEDDLLSDKESTDSGDSTHTSEVSLSSPELVPDVEVLQEVTLDQAERLPRPPSQPKRSSPTALKRRARKTKVSKSDGEIYDQKKESVSLVKSSSLQDCVLMSCEVTELTLQEASLDKEDALLSSRESSDAGDFSTHFSDVSLTPPEFAELFQDASLDEEDSLLSDEKSDGGDSTHFSEISLTPPELADPIQEAPLDEEYAILSEGESSHSVKSSHFTELSQTPPELAEIPQEAPLDEEDAPVSDESSSDDEDKIDFSGVSLTPPEFAQLILEASLRKVSEEDSSESVDSSHFTELSQTPPELVELVHEAPLDEEDALLSDKESTDSGDSTHTSEVSLSSPELVPDVEVLQEATLDQAERLPRPPSQPKRSSPTALKRRARKIKVSKSDGEIYDQKKESVSLVKSSSLQHCVLMSCEVTEQTLQEASLDKEDALLNSGESSDAGDFSTHFSDVSLTPPEFAELFQDAPLDEEDALVSTEKSPDVRDSTHFSDVSLTPPEFAELFQDAPLDEEDSLLSDEKSDGGDSTHFSEISLTPPELADPIQEAPLDEEYAILSEGESSHSVKSSHFTELSQTPPELAEIPQEAPLDEEDAPVSDESSSDDEDKIDFSGVSLTPPELAQLILEASLRKVSEEDSSESVDSSHFTELSQTPPELVELVHEAPLDEEDDLLSDKESTDSGDSTHTSEVSLSSPELVPDVEVLQEVTLDEAEHLPRPPSQPKSSSPTALKRRARKTKVSKSDGEICDQKKESVSLVKSSSLQDCVLMSCEVTEQTLQEASLDKEDALLSSRESSDAGDFSTHFSDVSLTPPEFAELFQDAPLDEEDSLLSDEKSDGGDSTHFSEISLTPPELADPIQEAPLDEEYAILSEGESSHSVKSSHFTELSQTPPELAEIPQEAPLDEEDAPVSNESSSDDEDKIDFSGVSLTPPEFAQLILEASLRKAEHLPRPPSKPKSSSPTALKRRARKTKVSKSDGEIYDQKKESVSLVKSSSLQHCVLMSCEVTEQTLQEASLDKEYSPVSDEKSSDGGDNIEFSELSQSPPELAVLLHEVAQDEEDALLSSGESSDAGDFSTYFSDVSLTPPEFAELFQEAPLDEEDVLVSDEKSSDGSTDFSDVSLTPNELVPDVELLQEAPQNEEDSLLSDGESSLDGNGLTPPELAELIQEAPMDEEDAILSDGESSESVKSSHFTELSQTPPDLYELLHEALLDREDALLSDKEPSEVEDSTHISEVSLTTPELVPDVELHQEAPLDKAEHLPSPPSQPKRSSPTVLKRRARMTKVSKSDGEICEQTKSLALVKSLSLQDHGLMSCELTDKILQEAPLDKVLQVLPHKMSSESSSEDITTRTRATLPSKRPSSSSSSSAVASSSSSSSSLSSPSYPRSTSTSGSPLDLCRKVRVHKEVRRLSQQTRRRTSMSTDKVSPMKPYRLLPRRQSPEKAAKESFRGSVGKPPRSKKELYFPPILPQHRRRPDSQASKGLPRTTEKLKLPQIDPRSQRPGPSQHIRDRSSKREGVKLFHLPHRREEGVLSTEVLLKPQYRNGASIRLIGPGAVVLKGCPISKSPSAQKH